MSTSEIKTTVSQQFSDDFELVVAHYGLHERGEYQTAKAAARANIADATLTFATLAGEIRRDAA